MKAIRYHEHGDADVLTEDDVPTPEPAGDEVLVRVHAASVNPIDTYVRGGGVSPGGGLPHVGGADAAVDYSEDDVADRIREAAGNDVNVVLETHAAANVETDLEVLGRGGRIVVLGEEAPITIDPGASMTGKIADAQRRVMSSGSRGRVVLEIQ